MPSESYAPARRRYLWDEKEQRLVEITDDWQPSERRVPIVGDQLYEGARSPVDGTDISTRRKHREYLKATGLAMAEDFKGEWARAAKERSSGRTRDTTRRDDIGRAVYELEKRSR